MLRRNTADLGMQYDRLTPLNAAKYASTKVASSLLPIKNYLRFLAFAAGNGAIFAWPPIMPLAGQILKIRQRLQPTAIATGQIFMGASTFG